MIATPQYFFDFDENGVYRADPFGVDLEHPDEAPDQAMAILPDLARNEAPCGESYSFVCTVLDEKRRAIYRGTLVHRGEWLRTDDGIARRLG